MTGPIDDVASQFPKRKRNEDWYWPLGALDYGHEVREFFPEEAELLGVITILWNRQELALRRLFINVLEPRVHAYGEAIWDRQSTHQAKRDLLSLALLTADLSDWQRSILEQVLEKTRAVAERRNALIHAEYVVHGRTQVLHAKVKAPRSNKPPKHQKLSVSDLLEVLDDLQYLVQITEGSQFELLGPEAKARHDEMMRELGNLRPDAKATSDQEESPEG